jgi:beta-lactamase regulating signal transducer with metallopeptidase domain
LIQTRLAGLAPATSEIQANQNSAIAKLASSVASDKNATSTTIEAGAKVINKKKTDVETASIWANIAAKMVQYWWVGLIIAGVAALTAAIWLGVKAYNADAEAAKKASEAAEKLKESYEAVK